MNALTICSHFRRRNYPTEMIENALIKMRRMNGRDLLKPPNPSPDKSTNEDIFLITHYNPESNALRNIVKQTWPLLGRTNTTEQLFSKKIVFGNRRTQNLKDMLVHARIPKQPTDPSVLAQRTIKRKCIAHHCRYCPRLDKSGQLFCHTTCQKHTTMKNITCNSNNLIYCIKCTRCQKLYVGQTKNSIKERFKCHFYSITNLKKSETVVGRHFSTNNHQQLDDVQIYVLEFIQLGNETRASQRLRDETERKWIHKLQSTAPLGLNSAD